MTALILQARLDSSRLPGKSLLPLGLESPPARPLVFRVMEALAGIACDVKILACPKDCKKAFLPLAEEAGFDLFIGPKDDVLARYCGAIEYYKIDRVLRATGDNPFVFTDAANTLEGEALALNADYAVYAGIPHGTGVNCVSAEALLRAGREAETAFDREHVCPYLYSRPELFRLHLPLAPLCWQGPELNCTVDTEEDYRRANALYAALPPAVRNKGEYVIAACRKIAGFGKDRGAPG
jgi:spore coat polysaccharide biosynthesis protein SpsF